MNLSRERLLAQAASTGFRPEVLEKVLRLVSLLNALSSSPLVGDRIALKGGTALNLFFLDLPRLSVDIDLNYIGSISRGDLARERKPFLLALEATCAREGLSVQRRPTEYAGGKLVLRYLSALGSSANLEVDMNFLFRSLLWSVRSMNSMPVGETMASSIPVVDVHEVVAGKLVALLDRATARDLFDAAQLAEKAGLDTGKLRTAFVVYGAASRRDWRTVDLSNLPEDTVDVRNYLLPLLRGSAVDDRTMTDVATLRQRALPLLERVLPLTSAEVRFLDDINDRGVIDPALLTADDTLADRIRACPALMWKAQNVREYKGLV
jgi:predicted nucleotidyltransferase component of viral defense system